MILKSLDAEWLSSDNFPAMAIISQMRESAASIRVALVIESCKIKPVWFEQTNKRASDRIFIEHICSTWSHHQGSAQIWNFAVTAGGNGYRLSLNTEEFTWVLGVVRSRSSHRLQGTAGRIDIEGSSGVLH